MGIKLMYMHISDPQAQMFWQVFSSNRDVNKEFYTLLPDDKLDFRMVDDGQVKSDSVRESLGHQIAVTRNYVAAVKNGNLKFETDIYTDQAWATATKQELLAAMEESEKELLHLLEDETIGKMMIHVPWSPESVPAVSVLYGLSSHEVLHTGWNIAVMDHLHMPRFEKLKMMWG